MAKVLRTFSRFLAIILLSLGTLLPSIPVNVFAQESTQTWMDMSQDPTISNGETVSDTEYFSLLGDKQSVLHDLECANKSIPLALDDYEGGAMPFDGCWFDTSIGEIERGGYAIKLKDSPIAGFINGFNSQLFPTRNSENFIEITPDSNDPSLKNLAIRRSDRFVNNTKMRPTQTGWDYPIFYEWEAPEPSFSIKEANGNSWGVDDNTIYSQMWYSDNGNWLVIWDTRGFFVRVDLQTLTVKTVFVETYASEAIYASLAISDNGRYVAVNMYGKHLRMYDLFSCQNTSPTYVDEPKHCDSRYFNYILSDFGASEYGNLPVFYGNDLLGFYIDQGNGEYWEYLLRAPNTGTSHYIALGDSYSSGEGAYSYLGGTDEANNRCHVSSLSYPFLLGDDLGLDSAHSVACSGAKIHNIAGGHENEAAQNKKPTNDQSLGKWQPGYKWQIEHLRDEDNLIDIVTVGISGNDIGFSDKLTECLKPSTCFASFEDRLMIANEINDQFDRLVSTYKAIRSGTRDRQRDAKIYTIGYPEIAKTNGDCGVNVGLNNEEIIFSNLLITYLNNMISQAAKRAGILYVDIQDALSGHTLCEDTETPAVHGVSIGDSTPLPGIGVFENESYHPTSFGHSLIAKSIEEETKGLIRSMPRPDKNAEAPDPLSSQLVGDAPESGKKIRKLMYGEELSEDMIVKSDNQVIYASGNKYQLKANETYELGFTSTYTPIGSFKTDEHGDFIAKFKIPHVIKEGLHTLHLYGKNTDEQEIDIYRTLYVANSMDDWDGDGIPNTDDCTATGLFLTDEENTCETKLEILEATSDSKSVLTIEKFKHVSNEHSVVQGLHQNKTQTRPFHYATGAGNQSASILVLVLIIALGAIIVGRLFIYQFVSIKRSD